MLEAGILIHRPRRGGGDGQHGSQSSPHRTTRKGYYPQTLEPYRGIDKDNTIHRLNMILI